MDSNRPSPAGQSKRRILVVEDDPHTRRINLLALRSVGFETMEARDGQEAVRLCLESRPALVVLDLAIPKVSGLDVLEAIKRELGAAAPLVLVLTAHAMREDLDAARQAGCDSYLAKPIDPFDLVDEIGRLLAARSESP